jgi:epoxyqueuosine reductase QueG
VTTDVTVVLEEAYEEHADRYCDDEGRRLFNPPLVGVARADDPLFTQVKEVIGAFYWTPQEALTLAEPDAEARSVVSWSLPVCQAARDSNREETEYAGRGWARARTVADALLKSMVEVLVAALHAAGHRAAAVGKLPENKVNKYPGIGRSAFWSERHTAFVAGLGTFGISGGLITRRGIAHRLCSVVTDATLPVTPRPYGDDPFAWCLRTARGTCGVCIKRCPVGSIGETAAERDKSLCIGQIRHVASGGPERYGWEGSYGCGLCQVAVPCESRVPKGLDEERLDS